MSKEKIKKDDDATLKVNFYNLSIEVTRRCNMQCRHCMRGDAQNIDLQLDKIEKILPQISNICDLVLTGGEPSMVPNIMHELLQLFQKYRVNVNNVYIVTNGKDITPEFIMACLEWYLYCDDNELSAVALSQDEFHDEIEQTNIEKLKALSFFNDTDKAVDFRKSYALNIGRAKKLNNQRKQQPIRVQPTAYINESSNELNIVDCNLAITVNGDILSDADYEYTETDNIKIGDTNDKLEELFTDIVDDIY